MNHTITSEDENILQITAQIKKFQFEQAEKLIKDTLKESEIIRTLHRITELETGLLTYTFVNYILAKEESAFWHRVAACIAAESLDKIVLSNDAGLYHVLRAIELNPEDWLLKEYALGFYHKSAMEKEKAIELANEVLKAEPNNKLALRILAE